ncbi:hypothetical protein PsorP6_006172 [Peronosclerospora sorghi]|uniref:Uncharacterized protein n=1 Tax=Peronosclerospora sorghi TaxID=230839 RepID=A0ACC0W681_9STRA|nr:hypothetical protein PsorP6_006172 [Peronosclerospora sorghi]
MHFTHLVRWRRLPKRSALCFAPSQRFSSLKTFSDLGLDDRIISGLKDMNITTPTGIQAKTIPLILARQETLLCAAQTGTGKTLAYLTPVIEHILRAEAVAKTDVVPSRPGALILLPSRELALQVASIAKTLSHAAKFASCSITSGERKSIQQKKLARRLDLVIGTPGRVAKCIASSDFFLSRLHTIVIDEADTLLDAKMGFRQQVDAVVGPIQTSAAKRKQGLQVILAAATMRSPLDQVVKKKFPNLRIVSDEKIHQTPRNIQQEFRRVTPESKHSALREALRSRRQPTAKTMVFCRNAASVRSTEHMLREHGFQETVCLHGDMPLARRQDAIEAFSKDTAVSILVCTDLAARGLDFDAVKHVLMFDFPKTAIDYVHRAGRTGRAGDDGHVTSLVTKHDLALARSIQNSKRDNRTMKQLRQGVATSFAVQRTASNSSRMKQQGRDSCPTLGRGTKKLPRHKIRTPRV